MPSPFWARHSDRRPFLVGRMRIAAALRQFFAARDFVEVETGTLVPSPGNETHLHAFASDLVSPADTRERLYLRTSPEFACKKLLAAGEPRIVEFARSFRNRERGVLHHPEFTLIEWYRANEPYEALMEDCAAILALAAEAAGARRFSFRGPADRSLRHSRAADGRQRRLRATPASTSWRCCRRSLRRGSPPPRAPPASAPPPTTPGATFSAACWSRRSSRVSASDARRSSTNIRPCSRRSPGRTLPIRGWPNGSSSMPAGSSWRTDSASSPMSSSSVGGSRSRWRRRSSIYGERYPIDEDFLAALAVMPPASGVALGFDRLVMLATGAPPHRAGAVDADVRAKYE